MPSLLTTVVSDNDSESGFDIIATISITGLVRLADALNLIKDGVLETLDDALVMRQDLLHLTPGDKGILLEEESSVP